MAAIAIYVPNGFKNLCPCEDNAGIGSKEYKGIVFKAGKVDFFPAPKYPALVLPYFQSRKGQHGSGHNLQGFNLYIVSDCRYNFVNRFFLLFIKCQQ